MLLLGSESGTRHLRQMAVAIGGACALLHHVTLSTPVVGQQGCLWGMVSFRHQHFPFYVCVILNLEAQKNIN